MKKTEIILTGLILLLNAACSTITSDQQTVSRSASVAKVPAQQLDTVRAGVKALEAAGSVQRGGLYLREIDGESYLFQYVENSGSGEAGFQGLEAWLEPLPAAARKGLVREPMERIFYEAGVADKTPEMDVMRIAMFTELKPEKEAHYRLLHDNPWPDVIAAIHKANFRHFSVFLEEIDGRVYLFGWLEYVGSDIDADGAENKKDPASIRWWKETDACQIAPPDADGGMWGGMEEILFVK